MRDIKLKSFIKNKSTNEIRSFIWDVFIDDSSKCLNQNEELLDYGLQWTGLTDKNGKDIYEDDIICFHLKNIKGIVKYDSFIGAFILKEINSTKEDLLYHYLTSIGYEESNKIIGNVYENPELLEDNK